MRIGIDATNAGSGGGIVHLKEFCSNIYFLKEQFPSLKYIIVFGSTKFLNNLPNTDGLIKKTHPLLNKSLLSRYRFQLIHFDREIQKNCDVLLSLTGDYIGKFRPVVGMSRNMLLYDRKIWRKIKSPKEILRFWLIYQKQKKSFKLSEGIIFISQYAKQLITSKLNFQDKRIKIIHHGISPMFSGDVSFQKHISEYSFENPFKLIYVSTVHVYKHQWNVVEAIHNLRLKGFPVELYLLGGIIFEPAGKKLIRTIKKVDPKGDFIHFKGHVTHSEIPKYYSMANGVIFASSCENMPNTLIEGMASGLPILCSNIEPMPEFLGNNGFYFDPYNVNSISESIEFFLTSPALRKINAENALKAVSKFSWKKTSLETMEFLVHMNNEKNINQ